MRLLRTPSRHVGGRTLIELLIALVIGFVVLGAVMMTFINTNRTSAVNQQMARLQQDAAFATQILTSQLKLAGYSATVGFPVLSDGSTGLIVYNRNHGGPAVVGCDNGFSNANTAIDYTALACAQPGASPQPDAINVIYEGDPFNTVPTAGGLPTDCLGAGVAPAVPSSAAQTPGNLYSRVENRYYIANNAGTPALFCAGGAGPGQPLVDNVINMQITYGVAGTPAANSRFDPSSPFFEPVRYLTATQVNALAPFPSTATGPDSRWNQVVSATICLELRSDQGALDQPTAHTDCQGAQQPAVVGDTRAYRTIRIQVGFKNRTSPCPDSSVTTTRPDHCDITL
jgi:type IV pilus assembly protein PilW